MAVGGFAARTRDDLGTSDLLRRKDLCPEEVEEGVVEVVGVALSTGLGLAASGLEKSW